MVVQSTKKVSGSGASCCGENRSAVGGGEVSGRDVQGSAVKGSAVKGPDARVAAVCQALEAPLTVLSELVEAASGHVEQSDELRAVLERVGRQAAAVHALVHGALTSELAARSGVSDRAVRSGVATQDAYTLPSHVDVGGVVSLVPSHVDVEGVVSLVPSRVRVDGAADEAEFRAPIDVDIVMPVSGTRVSVTAVDAVAVHASPMRRNPLRRKVPGPDERSALHPLTRRETEVLALVARGIPSREIAHRLGITSATVRSHIQHILTKLGVCNRRQAAALLAGRLSASVRARLRSTRGAAAVVPAVPAVSDTPAVPDVFLDPDVSLDPVVSPTAGPVASVSGFARLTQREVQVLRCLAAGLGRSEIAERLYVSPHTARTHIQRVLTKLGVHSVLGAMAVAQTIGLAPAP